MLLEALEHLAVCADDGLDHDDLDLVPEPSPVAAACLQIFPECFEAPLVSLELPGLAVVLEGVAVLVDGVVGQMDELVPEVSLVGVERFSSEPYQTVVIEIQPRSVSYSKQ